jgi:ketosteroid isomerase-like protein
MRRETEDLIRDGVAAFNTGDIDRMLAPIHPEIEFEPLKAVLEGSVYRGHAGFRQWLLDMAEDWEDFVIDVIEVRDLGGDRILVHARFHARARGSGVELDSPGAWLCEMRDGRIRRLRFYRDVEAALEGAGETV